MIAPVRKTVFAACSPTEAFDLFVDRIDSWWPKDSHSISASNSSAKPPTIVFEGKTGGRIYEVCSDGTIHNWGQVLDVERGRKLVFSWHVGRSEDQSSEVEINFSSADGRGTQVDLEHRNWDSFGETAQTDRNRYDSGWQFVLEQCYLAATHQNFRQSA